MIDVLGLAKSAVLAHLKMMSCGLADLSLSESESKSRTVAIMLCLFVLKTVGCYAQSDQPIYNDSLQNGWVNYGWATLDYSNPSPVHSGSDSISIKINSTPTSWDAIYIHHDAFDSTPYTNIT